MRATTTALALQTDTFYALDGQVVVRLLAGALLGGLVGLEREATDQAAGLRTHIAVALGAALFGVISTLGFLEVDQDRANSVVQVDVSRVASNVVVGIGFLGAGLIFRQGGAIKNLTTAASLWAVAAIGLACGVGDVTTAAVATAVLLGSLVLLRPVRELIRQRWAARATHVRVHLRTGGDIGPVLEAIGRSHDVQLTGLMVEADDGHAVVSTEVAGAAPAVRRWMAALASQADVASVGEG